MSTRLVGALLCAVAVAGGGVARAGSPTPPQLTDPAGDAQYLGDNDIVSGLLEMRTVPVKRQHGPDDQAEDLVLTMTFAQPPSATPGHRVELVAASSACKDATVTFSWTPGALLQAGDIHLTDCATGTDVFVTDVKARVDGRSVVWEVPLELVPSLPPGTVLSGIHAASELVEPVTGVIGTNITGGSTSGDRASTTKTFQVT